jgi:hypothetical protein
MKFFPLVKHQNIGPYPFSLRIILACFRYPSRGLSPWGGYAGGVVAASASSVASSHASSVSTTVSVPGTRRSYGAHQDRTRSFLPQHRQDTPPRRPLLQPEGPLYPKA